ncbi:MAG: hypothetical protein HQM14_17670, partial [SAR324 cluster bacterium]|nr:hypothetical protein [SAR324 cluster bacterium]
MKSLKLFWIVGLIISIILSGCSGEEETISCMDEDECITEGGGGAGGIAAAVGGLAVVGVAAGGGGGGGGGSSSSSSSSSTPEPEQPSEIAVSGI